MILGHQASPYLPHGMPYTARGPHVLGLHPTDPIDRIPGYTHTVQPKGLVKEHTLQPIHNLRHLRRRS